MITIITKDGIESKITQDTFKLISHIPYFRDIEEEFTSDIPIPIPISLREFYDLINFHDPLSNLINLLRISDLLRDDDGCKLLLEQIIQYPEEKIIEKDIPVHILGWILGEMHHEFGKDDILDYKIAPWIKKLSYRSFPTREIFYRWFPECINAYSYHHKYQLNNLWNKICSYLILRNDRIIDIHTEDSYLLKSCRRTNIRKISGYIWDASLSNLLIYNPNINIDDIICYGFLDNNTRNTIIDDILWCAINNNGKFKAQFSFDHIEYIGHGINTKSTIPKLVPDRLNEYFEVELLDKKRCRITKIKNNTEFDTFLSLPNPITPYFDISEYYTTKDIKEININLPLHVDDLTIAIECNRDTLEKVDVCFHRLIGKSFLDDFRHLYSLLINIPYVNLSMENTNYPSGKLRDNFVNDMLEAGFSIQEEDNLIKINIIRI